MEALYFVNVLLRMYQIERQKQGDPDPRRQSYRLAELWAALCILTGEPLPADITAILNEQPFPTVVAKEADHDRTDSTDR